MTKEEHQYNEDIISYLQEENEKLTSEERTMVSKCLSSKDHKPTKQDIAICISEARKKSKMGKVRGPDISTLPPVERKTIGL